VILNIAGPPCSGKSTISARYVLEHPHFVYTSIDAIRAEIPLVDDSGRSVLRHEQKAWQAVRHILLTNQDVLLESSGLSWQLEVQLSDQIIINHHKGLIRTICLYAPRGQLVSRLDLRHYKRDSHQLYRNEFEFIDWSLERLNQIRPAPDIQVDTSQITIEDSVRIFEEQVNLTKAAYYRDEQLGVH
jgi:hypothetical protein